MYKLHLFLTTISYLKPKQIYYRLFYIIRNKLQSFLELTSPLSIQSIPCKLNLVESISSYTTYQKEKNFTFLNLSFLFNDKIDWNYSAYGKLWGYNLNYFEYLNQSHMDKDEALYLINSFIKNNKINNLGMQAFPTSLRIINWIKFLTQEKIENQRINDSMYAQTKKLYKNIEYHLCGNHVLENAFALLFAAYFFKDETFYLKAKNILEKELTEQVLKDGGHYELSPMYHQLMLFRLLDAINLLQNNNYKSDNLIELLQKKASLMLAWLENISYASGKVPLFNDSSNFIAPPSNELFFYAKRLNIEFKYIPLSDSGYRKIKKRNYTCILDIGAIGPDYIPGHAHADTFNYELQLNTREFIVDSGISTYEGNKRREYERGTSAHNTVGILSQNSSQVWDSFKVANRAYIISASENNNTIVASHNGYLKQHHIIHTRKWLFEEEKIYITETLTKETKAISYLHFHPSITKEEIFNRMNLDNLHYAIVPYFYASQFNKLETAYSLEIYFKKNLTIEIKTNEKGAF